MSDSGKEGLLKRWSRLKRQSATDNEQGDGLIPARANAGQKVTCDAIELTAARSDAEAAPAVVTGRGDDDKPAQQVSPELPSVDELNPDSDFAAFMDPKVDDDVRRAALKALFRDPDFNVTDGLDVYAEDYTKLEKLTPAMVAALRYAQRTLFGEDDRRGVVKATGNDTDSADAEQAVAAETRGGSQAAEVHAEVELNDPDKAEANMSTAELQQPLPESQHSRRDKN